VKLSDQSTKPAFLQSYPSSKHKDLTSKPTNAFAKEREVTKRQTQFQKGLTVSSKCLKASYALSLLVAKCKRPHNITKELIILCAVEIALVMFDEKIASLIKAVPSSDNTIQGRIQDMASDIVDQVVEKISKFSVYLDESIDIASKAQLLAFIQVSDSDDIMEHVLFCHSLREKVTGEEIFKVIEDQFFMEQCILWQWCISICSDGAAAMKGRLSGLVARAKNVNPSIEWNHCIIHRQALASKHMNPVFHKAMDEAVKVINFIESRPLNSRLFRQVCTDLDSENTTLLLHNEVHWLSHGNVLRGLFQLRGEVHLFLRDGSSLAKFFEDEEWLCRLANLTDIFQKLNELNLALQGFGNHIFSVQDKITAFYRKLFLWLRQAKTGNYATFCTLTNFTEQNDENT
jgi:hypothetical protein